MLHFPITRTVAESSTQGHAAVLYSTSDNYSNGFAHIYPVCTTTRIAGHQNVVGTQRTISPGNAHLLTGLVTQPRKCPSAAATATATTATYTEMSSQLLAAANNDGDAGKYEYQLLLQQKVFQLKNTSEVSWVMVHSP